ncbi:S41 family peptidase [Streptococcus suis]|nr:S41 family peptidase [Streptococcus suis]
MEWAYLVKKAEQEAFTWNWLDNRVLYMKMENFYDEEKIGQLYTQIEPLLPTVKNLIIDVHINSGGSDSLYWPLLKYALPAGKSYKGMLTDEAGMEILYTPTNVAHRRKLFE